MTDLEAVDVRGELAAISQLRRTDPGTYNRDETMQARERELLDAQELPATSGPAPAVVADDPRSLPTLREALTHGIDGEVFLARSRLAGDILPGLDHADAAALRGAFDKLGELGVAALDAVAHGRVGSPTPATPEQLANFAACTGCSDLVREWGADAPIRVAVASARYSSVFEHLAPADWPRIQDFFFKLPDAARAALVRRLSE